MEKELEDAGIKLSAVATDILGVSGRAMLAALIDGERDVHVLAEMAKARMRTRIPDLVQALTGNFGEHHSFLCRLHLARIDQITAAIVELSKRIEEEMRPFVAQVKLQTIPGVGQATAEVIVADRRRHDPLSHPRPSLFLGRSVSRTPRIGRQTEIREHPPR